MSNPDEKAPIQEVPMVIRPANQGDVPFIFNSWLKSYNHHAIYPFRIPTEIYYKAHHDIVERILKSNTVLIACDAKDETSIYGYIVAGLTSGIPTIHYVYVKSLFRKLGIATALMNCLDANMDYAILISHMSKAFEKSFQTKGNFIYNPYLVTESIDNFATISYKLADQYHLNKKEDLKNKELDLDGEKNDNIKN